MDQELSDGKVNIYLLLINIYLATVTHKDDNILLLLIKMTMMMIMRMMMVMICLELDLTKKAEKPCLFHTALILGILAAANFVEKSFGFETNQ